MLLDYLCLLWLCNLLVLQLFLEVSETVLLKGHAIDGDGASWSCSCSGVSDVLLLSFFLLLLILRLSLAFELGCQGTLGDALLLLLVHVLERSFRLLICLMLIGILNWSLALHHLLLLLNSGSFLRLLVLHMLLNLISILLLLLGCGKSVNICSSIVDLLAHVVIACNCTSAISSSYCICSRIYHLICL